LRTGGTLWCWGGNFEGQLGDGTTTLVRLTPTRVGTASNWTSVSAEVASTLGLASDT
jgi:alpha-tubulin suppressor-like RCC1 family protein